MGQTANLGLPTIDNVELSGSLPDNWQALANGVNAAMGILDTIYSQGAPYAVKKTIVSSTIKAATPTDVTTASDDMLIEQIVMETDSVGLAGGTNFELLNNNANGVTGIFLSQAISGLGANVNVLGTSAGVAAMKPFVLEKGKKIQVQCTASDCTGPGVITLAIYGRRMGPASALS